MTSFNYAHYISEAIESIIAQTYSDWELIIVDDGSSDDSLNIIKRYAESDSRIKLYTHQDNSNKGLAESIKLGLKHSTSPWVAFLESDDFWKNNALEKMVSCLKFSPDLVFSCPEVIGETSQAECLKKLTEQQYPKYYDINNSGFIEKFADLIGQINIIPTFSVVMVKKELLDRCCFNSVIKPYLDYYLWAQLANNRVYYLCEKIVCWRAHSGSYITKNKFNFVQNLLFRSQIHYNVLKVKHPILAIVKTLNFIRVRIFYVKISDGFFSIYITDKLILRVRIK